MADSTMIDTLNKHWKDDKKRFGYKMLLKMGWDSEKGLGKDGEGVVSHIKVKKREEGLGLGMEKEIDGAGLNAWSQTTSNFDAVLSALKETYKTTEKKSKSSKKAPIISVGIK